MKQGTEWPDPTNDRSDRFGSEMTVHASLEEAREAVHRNREAVRSERRRHYERRLRSILEANPEVLTHATPHGLAAYLAQALTQEAQS